VLHEQLGFRGYVMSDFMATQSTVESANAGLDWELTMVGRWGAQLLAVVQAGEVPLATIDEMVRRILRPTVGLGLLDHPLRAGLAPVREHGAQARAIAEQGIVLLKNAGDLLPIASSDLRVIVRADHTPRSAFRRDLELSAPSLHPPRALDYARPPYCWPRVCGR
jgi:beta-glucosidase